MAVTLWIKKDMYSILFQKIYGGSDTKTSTNSDREMKMDT